MDSKLNQQIKVINRLLKLPENRLCADCKMPSPSWASLNIGVFICIKCSGCHRQLGVHISRVKSTNLDVWPQEVLNYFHSINNKIANGYWEKRLPAFDYMLIRNNDEKLFQFIRMKYEFKKYADKNGVDPMISAINNYNSHSNGNDNSKSIENKETKQYNNKSDLIDDDYEEGNDTQAQYQAHRKRYCSVDKIGLSFDNNIAPSNNYYNHQLNYIQQLNINEKGFSSQPGNNMSHQSNITALFNFNNNNQQHKQQQPQSFNTSYNQNDFLNANNNQYNNNHKPIQICLKPINNNLNSNNDNNYPNSTPNTQSVAFFNFNQSNQNNTFQGQDPFQQFIK